MTARSAGIVYGGGNNVFSPDRYVSPAETQAILSRTLRYVGLEDRVFAFSEGEYSFLMTPYTIRADIAQALYELLCELPVPEETVFTFMADGEPVERRALSIDGESYLSLDVLREMFPELKAAKESEGDANDDEGVDPNAGRVPIPMERCDRVLLSAITIFNGETSAEVMSFISSGVPYVNLHQIAELLNMEIQWDGDMD